MYYSCIKTVNKKTNINISNGGGRSDEVENLKIKDISDSSTQILNPNPNIKIIYLD